MKTWYKNVLQRSKQEHWISVLSLFGNTLWLLIHLDNAKNSTLESYENIAEVHYHHAQDITPKEYADFAKKWIAMGCKVIGGCCTTTPEHIKLIADLRT